VVVEAVDTQLPLVHGAATPLSLHAIFGGQMLGEQATFCRKLQAAYAAAKKALQKVRSELAQINASAGSSLDEGLEDTLTLHRLGVFKELGRSFKTTNCLENLNALIGQRTDKVDCWRNAEQKHRWLATTLLDLEPRLRKVWGYRQLCGSVQPSKRI